MQELITVIVPIYNKEKYVSACIESIINQTYTNLEILLINDGSTDSSEKICKEYAKKDARIKLISTENRGAARARNSGIDMAKGKFLSFIDADDIIAKTYYETMFEMIQNYDADIVECALTIIPEGSKYEFPEKKCVVHLRSRNDALIELYGKNNEEHLKTVIMCNKLFKKNLFSNIRYIPGRIIDDETIIYRLISKTRKLVEIDDIMYGYVQSQNSIMRKDFSMKRLNDSVEVYDECIDYFKKEPEIQACCIKRALYFYGFFIPKISASHVIDKQEAMNILKEKYEEKLKMYTLLPEIAREFVDLSEVISDYEKNIKQYT